MDHLASLDELRLRQGRDPIAFDRGLEAEMLSRVLSAVSHAVIRAIFTRQFSRT
jgi:hypothetical protein